MRQPIYLGNLFVGSAVVWAIGASFYILISPLYGQGVSFRLNIGAADGVIRTFTTEQSWYEAQGLWGILVLVIFSALYLLGARFAQRRNYISLTILGGFAIALSIISGFSIGGLYFPAAISLFIGALIFLLDSRSRQTPK
jgi:hypothetical protein